MKALDSPYRGYHSVNADSNAKKEAQSIIKTFIKTENEAEQIKSKVNRKYKADLWPSQQRKEDQTRNFDESHGSLNDDVDLALDIIKQRSNNQNAVPKNDVAFNMELRHAKINQKRDQRRV